MNKVPERFKIKYEFKARYQGDGVEVHLLADLDYIDARFAELKECYDKIAKKIGEINIASRSGALEFAIANSLVSYYSVSAIRLNSKRECLLDAQKPKKELTALEIKQREEASEKYASRVYTGKLSQG